MPNPCSRHYLLTILSLLSDVIEHQDSNESGHSPGADSDIKDYEHGILKRDGYSSSNK